MKDRGQVLPSLLIATVLACDPGTEETASILSDDWGPIVVREYADSSARAASGWHVAHAPELVIGTALGEGPCLFSAIQSVAQLPNGQVAVFDRISQEICTFDSNGRFLWRLGGKGEGPGEFRSGMLVPAPSYDSLLVFDSRMRRFTTVSAQGKIGAVFSSPSTNLGVPVGRLATGVLLTEKSTHVFVPDEPEGPVPDSSAFLLFDFSLGAVDTVAVLQAQSLFKFLRQDVPYIRSNPFDPPSSAAVGEDRFFLTEGEEPFIEVYDHLGRKQSVIRAAEMPAKLTRGEIELLQRDVVTSLDWTPSAAELRAYDEMPKPDVRPAFERMMVDSEGFLWAGDFSTRSPTATSWLVFNPEGSPVGVVKTPPGLEMRQIGLDFVLGIWEGEFGEESVRRYRLYRQQGPV